MRPAVDRPGPAPVAVKVPAITVLFWVVKVLTTGIGEAASDYLGGVSIALAGVVGLLGLAAALALQLRTRRYVPVVYWTAVLMVAVFGTMAADALHVVLGIPYAASSACYAVALAVVFVLWRRSEGTLSIHSIDTRRRELWYWLTVLLTFALGTALGDLTAVALHLGFLASAVLFAVVIAVPAIACRAGVDPVLTFWAAYVVTRPLGASVADWLGKPATPAGGLGLGDGTVTAVGFLAFLVLVGWLQRTGSGQQGTAGTGALGSGRTAATPVAHSARGRAGRR
jgi:uncharacterized membrane-anchored protein